MRNILGGSKFGVLQKSFRSWNMLSVLVFGEVISAVKGSATANNQH
jgi:hypothetical protein